MISLVRHACAVVLIVGLAGCATKGEPEFGSSVRHMIEGQIYDPAAPSSAMGALDGQKAAQAVKGYHAEKKAAGKAPTSSAVIIPTSQ
jgi:hypothetical protein